MAIRATRIGNLNRTVRVAAAALAAVGIVGLSAATAQAAVTSLKGPLRDTPEQAAADIQGLSDQCHNSHGISHGGTVTPTVGEAHKVEPGVSNAPKQWYGQIECADR